jgi:acetyltransferase-like isoleucine patch superfamily enzyme
MNSIIQIRSVIESELNKKRTQFIIYPYGERGMLVEYILQTIYHISPAYIIDEHLSNYSPKVTTFEKLKKEGVDLSQYTCIISTANGDLLIELEANAKKYLNPIQIVEIIEKTPEKFKTKVGKYSYGSLCCNHCLIEEVGAFTSIAAGCSVLPNHPMKELSTHPFMYMGSENFFLNTLPYDGYKDFVWYFPGVSPAAKVPKIKRITIGNDVWIGENVLITNSANIGNGAIVGAGAIVTKDVPDYAIVVGNPARILRYRYKAEEIEALNRIAWWDWPDDKIRKYYSDLYLPVKTFIEKHDT